MRCGVFLCQCGGNISGVLDLDSLAEASKSRDGVVSVAINQFMCGTEGRDLIEHAVEERGLDHFVIGSCSRRFQGPTFERIARELKLGENAVAFANLREGCSFVHKDEPEKAQKKAEKIVAAAVQRARFQADLPRARTFLHRSALVVGGGIAGLSAAEELAEAGIEVHLVEKQQTIGGYMARLSKTFPTEDCAMCSLSPRLTNAATDSRIHIHSLSDVTEIVGPPGEFRVTVRHRPRYVSEQCVGCGECVPACPVHVANASPSARRSRARSPAPCRRRSRSTTRAGRHAKRPAPCTPPPKATRRSSPPVALTTPSASPANRTHSRASADASARTCARPSARAATSSSRSRSPA
jgi:heterodisulfide reductase subunit A